jgi:hypothetical protein
LAHNGIQTVDLALERCPIEGLLTVWAIVINPYQMEKEFTGLLFVRSQSYNRELQHHD